MSPIVFHEYRPRPGSRMVHACDLCGPERKDRSIPACPFWARWWVYDDSPSARGMKPKWKLYLCNRHKVGEERARRKRPRESARRGAALIGRAAALIRRIRADQASSGGEAFAVICPGL